MRIKSLRALLLALAMVVQTIAGANGVAHAMAPLAPEAALEHCVNANAPNDASAPSHDGHDAGGHRACQHCLFCTGGAGVATSPQSVAFIVERTVARIGFVRSQNGQAPTQVTHIWRARGPPSARA